VPPAWTRQVCSCGTCALAPQGCCIAGQPCQSVGKSRIRQLSARMYSCTCSFACLTGRQLALHACHAPTSTSNAYTSTHFGPPPTCTSTHHAAVGSQPQKTLPRALPGVRLAFIDSTAHSRVKMAYKAALAGLVVLMACTTAQARQQELSCMQQHLKPSAWPPIDSLPASQRHPAGLSPPVGHEAGSQL
jgi:hypothetical protein